MSGVSPDGRTVYLSAPLQYQHYGCGCRVLALPVGLPLPMLLPLAPSLLLAHVCLL